eukprot:CAMPEP_0198310386 /NCGR_PEP_ID=MMETSP1450-20131203/2492_1 /TAXON_ID=753684 ORGANISM="Madagascaria erythrocladiodes, Strain CCMP3234" /NCGR_SAMPLE_ID=MMETSP1450 /ASSEMBLY_ACC=CAM_ASM_001115 /LENGTH=50 /DNA_ID=CAMNT_0044013211 /DNA_START=131 /DNA_END=280 /DNA_ORIENTATION=+
MFAFTSSFAPSLKVRAGAAVEPRRAGIQMNDLPYGPPSQSSRSSYGSRPS